MRSLLMVLTPPAATALTTLDTAKADLGVNVPFDDDKLQRKIDAASGAIWRHLNRFPGRATVRETFRLDGEHAEALLLARGPNIAIASVTVDGTELDADEYEVDDGAGLLYRLADGGGTWCWLACRSVVVEYSGGWLLPDEDGRDLPAEIEDACLIAVRALWSGLDRDPMLRSEQVPEVYSVSYWSSSAAGNSSGLPGEAAEKLAAWVRYGA